MVTVKMPPVLRPLVNGAKEVQANGNTVKEVLDSLINEYPQLKDQLFNNENELNRYVNIYVRDEDIRVQDGLATTISENDTLVILPAMAGGI